MAFFKVVVICDCPTTVLKFWGRYLRAETINLSMIITRYLMIIVHVPVTSTGYSKINESRWLCQHRMPGKFFISIEKKPVSDQFTAEIGFPKVPGDIDHVGIKIADPL